jgi:hypothetical protein
MPRDRICMYNIPKNALAWSRPSLPHRITMARRILGPLMIRGWIGLFARE